MEDISTYLANISIMTYLVVFLAGVLTSFTPCVYPLIPIIVGVIGSTKEQARIRNFILSLSYVLGMALSFSILGVISALSTRVFGQLQASPLAQIIVGIIIILFALVLLDVIALPTFLLNRVGLGKMRKGGLVVPVFIMGVASGFVVAPCSVAVLGALLAYVASSQNIIFGFTLLFTFATGLGTLLILVGTFTSILKALPKSGQWMRLIQRAMALALIILGGYFIFRGGLLIQ